MWLRGSCGGEEKHNRKSVRGSTVSAGESLFSHSSTSLLVTYSERNSRLPVVQLAADSLGHSASPWLMCHLVRYSSSSPHPQTPGHDSDRILMLRRQAGARDEILSFLSFTTSAQRESESNSDKRARNGTAVITIPFEGLFPKAKSRITPLHLKS